MEKDESRGRMVMRMGPVAAKVRVMKARSEMHEDAADEVCTWVHVLNGGECETFFLFFLVLLTHLQISF